MTPQGAHWVDFGVFAEYEIAAKKEDADEVIFGPLLEKELGDWLATANLFLDKQVGKNADEGTAFRYGVQLRYRWRPELQPGLEAYGEPGEIADFKPTDLHTHQLGPVIFGRLPLGPLPGELKYEVGYLFGLTPGTPEGNVKWRLEYEFRF